MRYLIVNVPSNLLLQGLSDLSRSTFSRKLVEAGDRVQEIFHSRIFFKINPDDLQVGRKHVTIKTSGLDNFKENS